MCRLESCQHVTKNSGEWHLPCCPCLHLVLINKIKNVSSFREELNQTVPEIGQKPRLLSPAVSPTCSLLSRVASRGEWWRPWAWLRPLLLHAAVEGHLLQLGQLTSSYSHDAIPHQSNSQSYLKSQ